MSNGTNGNARNGRIDFLKQKLEADRAALAKEHMKHAMRAKRKKKKLEGLVGAAVMKELDALKTGNPKEAEALETILRGIFQSVASTLNESDKKLLRSEGWL
jgi:hypothetical protein